jgi:hypothetical protein
VILLFALLTIACAVAVAVLFLTEWLEGDVPATTALGVALFSVLVLAITALGVAQ